MLGLDIPEAGWGLVWERVKVGSGWVWVDVLQLAWCII